MAAVDAVLKVRIDGETKAKAAAVLEEIGLFMSDAVRLLFRRVVADKALPFELKTPNATTIKTMRESDRGKNLKRFDSADALFKDIGI